MGETSYQKKIKYCNMVMMFWYLVMVWSLILIECHKIQEISSLSIYSIHAMHSCYLKKCLDIYNHSYLQISISHSVSAIYLKMNKSALTDQFGLGNSLEPVYWPVFIASKVNLCYYFYDYTETQVFHIF